MERLETFRDIAPYRGQDFFDAVARVKQNKAGIGEILASVVPKEQRSMLPGLAEKTAYVLEQLDHVESYDDFQRTITAGVFLPMILEQSVDAFTISGAEHLDSESAYLYVSTHRDIILDCALIDLALEREDQMLCEMAIGDNLLLNEFVTDLFKLNGGVTVKRGLPMRETYLETLKLSSYLVTLLNDFNKSVWIAQKSGRSKDGLDITSPAVIKMLHLSQRKKGRTFTEVINSCRIVPVAVSYEKDPCDVLKAREEVAVQRTGERTKRPFEDLISMAQGLKGDKGRIHISFGTPIAGEYADSEAVAAEVDRQIHTIYKLWPTNLFAYDYLEGSTRFAEHYADFDSKAFLRRFRATRSAVRSAALNAYANPVRSYLAATEEQ